MLQPIQYKTVTTEKCIIHFYHRTHLMLLTTRKGTIHYIIYFKAVSNRGPLHCLCLICTCKCRSNLLLTVSVMGSHHLLDDTNDSNVLNSTAWKRTKHYTMADSQVQMQSSIQYTTPKHKKKRYKYAVIPKIKLYWGKLPEWHFSVLKFWVRQINEMAVQTEAANHCLCLPSAAAKKFKH